MFCRKCGRQLDGDLTICPECEGITVDSYVSADMSYLDSITPCVETITPEGVAPASNGSRKAGLGKGIAAAVLGFVGFFMVYFALIFMAALLESGMGGMAMIFSAFVALIGVGCSIPALVFVIASLKLAIRQKKSGKVLPIPALVLGIAGCVFGGLGILFGAISLMLCVSGISMLAGV